MRKITFSSLRRTLKDESGQVLMPWLAVVSLSFLGITGLVTDVGRAYLAKGQLQNAANAAALAAAGEVYYTSGTDDAYNFATTYSGSSGDNNFGLSNVTTTISEGCVTQLLASGQSCSSTTPKNAVQVTESTTVRAYIMPIFWGSKNMTVTASATASMQGLAEPWNVAIILDATDSMVTNTDSNCSTGTATRFNCALASIQTLLGAIEPCTAGGSSCTPSNSNFRVALFSFPNRSTGTVADFYGCSGTIPTPEPYTMPLTNLTAYTPLTYSSVDATYLDTVPSTGNVDANGFESDYWSSNSTLNSSAEIVEEIGGKSGCTGMNTAGGESTYYGGIIYAAQAALTKEKSTYPNSRNAIILLTDGESSVTSTSKYGSGAVTPAADGYASTAYTTTGTYPSIDDQCQQAIVAAQTAANAGTRVYAVAYGSESDGCGVSGSGVTVTDTTTVATGNNQSFTASTLTPCITMENIASSLNFFYSDWNQSGSGSTCVDNSHTTTNLSDISLAIAATFTKPRLLPNAQFLYGVTQTS